MAVGAVVVVPCNTWCCRQSLCTHATHTPCPRLPQGLAHERRSALHPSTGWLTASGTALPPLLPPLRGAARRWARTHRPVLQAVHRSQELCEKGLNVVVGGVGGVLGRSSSSSSDDDWPRR